ncbi:DUF3050 domain-containing protein [Thioflexithrix psekupsensis]|uniref:Heme oxygenase n=1 Tax=Thioflexithrix psekupsensis TaxID=1570016 RepID=A0A251XAL7_9GAMM|nr:DUF3050 domain-containing protein [Thioflexithrix psekupsensis]OUD15472.1 heme oxygenase [Thioflexithrix psekupsensis]
MINQSTLPFHDDALIDLQQQLNQHPIYHALQTLEDLQCFMQHHVYSVWDFMSLIKYLQQQIAPTTVPWLPRGDRGVRRFINELVLEEESDQVPTEEGQDAVFSSHFELYCGAMREIGANTQVIEKFTDLLSQQHSVEHALTAAHVPLPARDFTRTTFTFIHSGQPHAVAAALALGREHIIPAMFRCFLARMGITETQAPTFHFYLKRHIHLDEDFHAPLSLRLLTALCHDSPEFLQQAQQAAVQALTARKAFWDGVLLSLPSQQL